MEKTNLLKMTSQEMRMMRRLLKNAQKWQTFAPQCAGLWKPTCVSAASM